MKKWKCVECGQYHDDYKEAKYCCVDEKDDVEFGEPDEPVYEEVVYVGR